MEKLKVVYEDEIVGLISGWDKIRFRGTIRWLASMSRDWFIHEHSWDFAERFRHLD